MSKLLSVERPPFAAMNRCVRIAAAVPIGMFTNNTDLHPNAAVRTPPAIDPAAKPADRTPTKMPNARVRAFPSGNVAARIANAVAGGNAPPAPWDAPGRGIRKGDRGHPAGQGGR